MLKVLNNVLHVLSCVLNVVLKDVSNVVVTESLLLMNVSVLLDTMKMLNANVQLVYTNVKNVLLIPNVPNVLKTESKKINQLVHVQSEPIILKMLLNVLPVLTNVVLVLITLLVLLVVKTDLTFQLVIVWMDTMNKPKFVMNVTTDVKLV